MKFSDRRFNKILKIFFCKVTHASKITRFKQDFLDDLQLVFDQLVDFTEPICQAIDSAKADMTIFDSSGIEAFVTENNPKYAHRIIRQLKAYAKAQGFDKSYDPYKAAYASMPSHASANPEIKQLFINGHFVMSSSSALSPMVWASSVISLSITKTLWRLILILLSKRNPTPPMKISVSMIQNF